jgi:uncharacterized protein
MIIQRYRYPFRFYFLSAAIPWFFWAIAAYLSRLENSADYLLQLSALGLLGLCGPIFVAGFFFLKDRELLNDLKKRCFNFKQPRKVYFALALLIMPGSILLAMAISLLFGHSIEQFAVTGSVSFTSGVFPAWFFLLVAPLLEELAWHTYGTDCLRQRFNLFYTSIIFSFYWALWHVPLAFIEGYFHNNLLVEGFIYNLNFSLSIFPFVFIMNWLYFKTGRNILVPIVIHMFANLFNEIFATHPDSKVIQTGFLLIVCIVVIYKERDMFFKREDPNMS